MRQRSVSGDLALRAFVRAPSALGTSPALLPNRGPRFERIEVRAVRAGDADAFQRVVMRLSPSSRRMPFHGAVHSCTPALLVALTQPDPATHRAWVALQRVDGDQAIIGEARLVSSDDGGEAELAIAVAEDQRGRGLADRLLQTVVDEATRAVVQTLFADVLEGNAPMFGLMRRHGFEPGFASGLVRWRRRLATKPAPE